MTYPVAGPGSALLERLDRVPRDGQWRTTREMCELMGYTGPRSQFLLVLFNFQHVERNEERGFSKSVRWIWRRTDA